MGRLALGTRQHANEEETSCDAPPTNTSFPAGSTCTPAPWSRCVLNQDGEIVLHRHMKAAPDTFLQAMAPYREALVVCVECLFTWSWLADLCTPEGLPVVLGHALYLQAIHGGKANNDPIAAHQIAVLRRGGMRPQADGSPAERRATRDVRRRRRHLLRQQAELLAHLPQTNRQDHLPEIGKKLAYQANREGVARRFPDPAVQKSLDVDLTLLDSDDRWLTDRALALVRTAQEHEAQPCYRLRAIPGLGKILALVRLYEIHDSRRFPRVPDCVS